MRGPVDPFPIPWVLPIPQRLWGDGGEAGAAPAGSAVSRVSNPSVPHPLLASDPFLARLITYGAENAVVPSTKGTYATAIKQYLRFCSDRRLAPWPVDEVQIAGFIHVLCLSISTSSLKSYLAGVQYGHVNAGCGPWPLHDNELIRRTKRFVKRRYPCELSKAKLPITMKVLRAILPLLPLWPKFEVMHLDDLTFALGSLIATCAFLRGGEAFRCAKQHRAVLLRNMFRLRLATCEGEPVQSLIVNVPQAKTTPHIRFMPVPLFQCKEAGVFDPVGLWKAYVRRFPSVGDDQVAFMMSDGRAVSRDYMVARTAELLQQAKIGLLDDEGRKLALCAASWRAGGTEWAIEAGVPELNIMAYGRWTSQAWKCYQKVSSRRLYKTALKMSQCSVAATGSLLVGGSAAALFRRVGASEDARVVDQALLSLKARKPVPIYMHVLRKPVQ